MSAGQLVDNSQHQGSQLVDANSQRNCPNNFSACLLVNSSGVSQTSPTNLHKHEIKKWGTVVAQNFPNNYYDQTKLGAEIIIWLDQDSRSRSGEQLRDVIYSFDKNGIQTQ